MDPVSHALFGRALNCLDRRRRLGPGAGAAFVLGSLAPDIDSLLVARGWDVYLQYHSAGTHALLAAPVLAAATAALVRLPRRQSRYSLLFLAALAGIVAGHLMFDLVSGSDMRLFAPLSDRSFGPHLLTMADLSAVVILLAGTLVSWWRRTTGGIVIVAGLAALVIVKGVSLGAAWPVYSSQAAGAEMVAHPEAVTGSLTRWRFYDRDEGVARAWDVDAWNGRGSIDFTRTSDDGVLVARSREMAVVRRFFGFAEIPIVRVERTGDQTRVLWSDLKYCDAAMCVMSFGAVFDEHGEPLAEIVQVGGFVRERRVTRER